MTYQMQTIKWVKENITQTESVQTGLLCYNCSGDLEPTFDNKSSKEIPFLLKIWICFFLSIKRSTTSSSELRRDVDQIYSGEKARNVSENPQLFSLCFLKSKRRV